MTAPLSDKLINIYYSKIIESGKKALLMETGKRFQKYQKAFNNIKLFHVSKMDPHPSKLAVQMFADILAQEILGEKQYGFQKNPK